MADDDKELTVEWSEQVKQKADKDPKLAKALREMGAIFRQARAGVNSGQYKTFDDAIEALTGQRPEKVENKDEESLRIRMRND